MSCFVRAEIVVWYGPRAARMPLQSGPKVSAAKVEALRRQKDMAVKRLKQSPRQKAKQEAKAKKMKNKEKKLVRTAKRQAKSSPAAAHK